MLHLPPTQLCVPFGMLQKTPQAPQLERSLVVLHLAAVTRDVVAIRLTRAADALAGTTDRVHAVTGAPAAAPGADTRDTVHRNRRRSRRRSAGHRCTSAARAASASPSESA